MNKWCPENNDLKRTREDDEDDYKQSKKSRLDEQAIIDEGEDVVFTKLAELFIHMSSQIWYIFKHPSRVVTRRHFLFNMFMIFSQSLSNTSVHFIFKLSDFSGVSVYILLHLATYHIW
jgi:hypothetical protein